MSINFRIPQSQIDWGGRTALHIAAGAGSYDVVDRLLAVQQAYIPRFKLPWRDGWRSLDVNARDDQGCTPLMRAAENGHDNIIELLAHTQNPSLDTKTRGFGYTALHLALSKGHITAAKALIHRGANIYAQDHGQSTVLSHALKHALYGHEETVQEEMFVLFWKLLPQASKDLHRRDNFGYSPLILGLRSSRSLEFAQMLLDKDYDPNAVDFYGFIWLSYPDDHTSPATLELLLSQPGTNPNFRDEYGRSLLARLVSSHIVSENLIRILLKNPRVHLCAKDEDGKTPLMIAARDGSLEVVRALLTSGKSKPSATDNHNLRAFDYAVQRKGWCQSVLKPNTASTRPWSAAFIKAAVKAQIAFEELEIAEQIVRIFWIATFTNLERPLSLELRPSPAQVWYPLLDACHDSLFDKRRRIMAHHLNVKSLAQSPSLSGVACNQTLVKVPYRLLS